MFVRIFTCNTVAFITVLGWNQRGLRLSIISGTEINYGTKNYQTKKNNSHNLTLYIFIT